MNTAKLLQHFAEGTRSVGSDIEVQTVRLYDLDYNGCMSCMVCKLKGEEHETIIAEAQAKMSQCAEQKKQVLKKYIE